MGHFTLASVGLHLNLHNQNISWVLSGKGAQSRSKGLKHFTKFATQSRSCSSSPSPQELYSSNALGQGFQKIVKMQNLGQKFRHSTFLKQMASVVLHLHHHKQCSGAGQEGSENWVATTTFKDVSRWHFVECCAKHMTAKDCTDFQAFVVNLFWHMPLRVDPGSSINTVKVVPVNVKESSFRLTNRAFYIYWIKSPINISLPRVSENFD